MTLVKEEMGHKQVVKTEYRGPKTGGLNANWNNAQSMIQVRKAELMARIKAQQIATGIKNGSIQEKRLDDDLSVMEQKQKPKGFDKLGRPLDQYGNLIELSMPGTDTLINQRRKAKDKFKRKFEDVSAEKVETQEEALEKVAKIDTEKLNSEGTLVADILRGDAIPETSQFFDPRFNEKKSARASRSFFDWHDEGTFIKKGKVMRQQAQLKDLQMQIETAAKRTGVQQASKLAAVAHSAVKDTMALTVNELDWWDKKIIMEHQQNIEEDFDVEEYEFQDISNLIEHPVEMLAPMKNTSTVQLPVYLTKRERKKIRRLRRKEDQKEDQEKIRLGLIPAPEPKVRLANMMQVLANEAVIEPSKVEAKVRDQMARRQKAHFDTNKARELTKDERRAKNEKKNKEDLSFGCDVGVYLVKDMTHAATRWKIKENVKQLYMTGCCITCQDYAIVVAEGGPKAQRKFRRLMLNRIKWREIAGEGDLPEEKESQAELREEVCDSKGNELCKVVWSGRRKAPTFKGDMVILRMASDIAGKEFFQKHGLVDYWHSIQAKLLITGTD